MICNSLRKAPKKINKQIANLRVRHINPTRNHTRRKVTLATICLLSIFVFCAATAVIGSNNRFVHASNVNGLGVGIYWDQACTNRTLSLNWGPIDAGSNNTLTIYIRNEMSSTASLSLQTTDFNPSTSSNYIALNWNYSGQVLSAGQVIPIELTLTVLPEISGITNFSFNTIITATER
jgi:hypothetical protein